MSEDQAKQNSKPAPAKAVPAPKDVSIRNNSSRPITLYATRADKVTILPTETVTISAEIAAKIQANDAAMSFFSSGDLVEA